GFVTLGRGENVRPLAIVGDQQQAGGVDVQAADGVQVARVDNAFQQVEHQRVGAVPVGAHITGRFVHDDVAEAAFQRQSLPIEGYHIGVGNCNGGGLGLIAVHQLPALFNGFGGQ